MKIFYTQKNSKSRCCGDRDEIINPIKREFNKLLQKTMKLDMAEYDW